MKTVKTLLPLLLAIITVIMFTESSTMVDSNVDEIRCRESIDNNSEKKPECLKLFSFGPRFLKEKMAELLSKWCAKKITEVINILDNLIRKKSRREVETAYKKCMEDYKSALVGFKNAAEDIKNKDFHGAKDLIGQAIASVRTCKDGLHDYDSTSPVTKQNAFLFSHLQTLLKIIIELL